LNQIFSIKAFLTGLPIGIVFSFALGPVFFSIIKTSLQNGFRSAVWISLGVIAADITLLAFAYSSVEAFLPKGINVAFWIQLVGGLVLLTFGIVTIVKKNENTEGVAADSTLIIKNISTGFFLNIINPANFAEWVGIAGLLKTKYHFEPYENYSFYGGALLAVLFTELLVAYFAEKLRRFLNPQVMRNINMTAGIIFVITAIWLLGDALL
jgi:threonine/homoserine/homoserine lactone efflux protein